MERCPAALTPTFNCLRWDSPNLEGQVPKFICPRNRVAQVYPQALGSLLIASYYSRSCEWNIGPSPARLLTLILIEDGFEARFISLETLFSLDWECSCWDFGRYRKRNVRRWKPSPGDVNEDGTARENVVRDIVNCRQCRSVNTSRKCARDRVI
jgi:hypothetical protein